MNNSIFFSLYSLAHKSDFFDKIVVFFTNDFLYVTLFMAVIFLIFHYTQNFIKDGFLVVSSGGLAWGIAHIIKNILQTPRPIILFPKIFPLIQETGYAFPSGHTTPLVAIAFAIFFLNKKAGYVFIICALVVGLARIIAGVHFPIDILGGFILGALTAYLVRFLYNKSIRKS